jgi:hypothetical protein
MLPLVVRWPGSPEDAPDEPSFVDESILRFVADGKSSAPDVAELVESFDGERRFRLISVDPFRSAHRYEVSLRLIRVAGVVVVDVVQIRRLQ